MAVLFPPLPQYGPPALGRRLLWAARQATSFVLSLSFLGVVVAGAVVAGVPGAVRRVWEGGDGEGDGRRQQQQREPRALSPPTDQESAQQPRDELVCDIGYYARRVGLEVETFTVQTEDGFLLELWHIIASSRAASPPGYPVLLLHGLLQSAGAFCVHDEGALAFFLCRSGFDVWLGNSRCGQRPRHTTWTADDPRMWRWTLRDMAAADLPALAGHVRRATGFGQVGLVGHSQGTAQALLAAAAREADPVPTADASSSPWAPFSVVCALAPAVYAGPLLYQSPCLRLIQALPSATAFRLVFGVHAFIPAMMWVHRWTQAAGHAARRAYGRLGYTVFSFLFGWTDARWDRRLRNRMFQFAPVHVSAEAMRWWLGHDGFAHHRCILATREEVEAEAAEEAENTAEAEASKATNAATPATSATTWFDERTPPLAFWVCGRDNLVDGRRLMRRLLPPVTYAAFAGGQAVSNTSQPSQREPLARVVHAKLLPDYEHLDVIWAADAVDQVFVEVRDVLWKTCPVRGQCRVPIGCEAVGEAHL